ncbi:MAG: peptidoglycan DD-metalloendopeptidase family protein [Roseovarius sp.]
MRLRYWTALIVTVCVAATLSFREARQTEVPVDALLTPSIDAPDIAPPADTGPDGPEPAEQPAEALAEEPQDARPSDAEVSTEVSNWSRAVEPGENLDVLLADAGLDAVARAEVSGAIGSEFDLRRLKPGHTLALEITADGRAKNATLEVDDGVNIHAAFGAEPSVRVAPPTLESIRQAGETEIENSIYAALEDAGIPTRFATDLELVFAGTLDLRRALVGGERMRIAWRENRLGDRVIGEPTIDFAELDLGEERYEVIWPEDGSSRTSIFKDDDLILTFDQPIRGARLSSAFGPRKHPIHGYVRMHSGVDFAAELGATVHATQAGRISFMGQKSGYGLMVEIDHAQDIKTIYAHLSAVNETLQVGQRIPAGQKIGDVGSTGTSTAPHLHYEVLVEGSPVPPLTDTHLSRIGDGTPHVDSPISIDAARDQLAALLAAADG